MKLKRILALAVSLAMVLSVIPALELTASALEVKNIDLTNSLSLKDDETEETNLLVCGSNSQHRRVTLLGITIPEIAQDEVITSAALVMTTEKTSNGDTRIYVDDASSVWTASSTSAAWSDVGIDAPLGEEITNVLVQNKGTTAQTISFDITNFVNGTVTADNRFIALRLYNFDTDGSERSVVEFYPQSDATYKPYLALTVSKRVSVTVKYSTDGTESGIIEALTETKEIIEPESAAFGEKYYSANGSNDLYTAAAQSLTESPAAPIQMTLTGNDQGPYALGAYVVASDTADSLKTTKSYTVTSANLIPNGNFAHGLTGWYNGTCTEASESYFVADAANGTLTVSNDGKEAGSRTEKGIFRTWRVTPEKKYVLVFTVDEALENCYIKECTEPNTIPDASLVENFTAGENAYFFTAKTDYIGFNAGWCNGRVFSNFGLYEVEDANASVVSVAEPEKVTVIEGNSPLLPKTLEAVDSLGNNIIAAVAWEPSDYSSAGIVKARGTVAGYTGADDITATTEVLKLSESLNDIAVSKSNVYTPLSSAITGKYAIEFNYTPENVTNNWFYFNDGKAMYNNGAAFGTANNTTGAMSARCAASNGGTADAEDVSLGTVKAGSTYRVLVQGDVRTDTYDLTITNTDGSVFVKKTGLYERKPSNVNQISYFNVGANGTAGAFTVSSIRISAVTYTSGIRYVDASDNTNVYAETELTERLAGEALFDAKEGETFYISGTKDNKTVAYIVSSPTAQRFAAAAESNYYAEVPVTMVEENAVLRDAFWIDDERNETDPTQMEPRNCFYGADYINRLFLSVRADAEADGIKKAPLDADGNKLYNTEKENPDFGNISLASSRIPFLQFNVPEYVDGKAYILRMPIWINENGICVHGNTWNQGNTEVRFAAYLLDNEYDVPDVTKSDTIEITDDRLKASGSAIISEWVEKDVSTEVRFDVTEAVKAAQGKTTMTFKILGAIGGVYFDSRQYAVLGSDREGSASFIDVVGPRNIKVLGADRVTKNGTDIYTTADIEGYITVPVTDGSFITIRPSEGFCAFVDNDQDPGLYTLKNGRATVESFIDNMIIHGIGAGITVADGAQVRYGQGVDKDGKIAPSIGDGTTADTASSGLRFIGLIGDTGLASYRNTAKGEAANLEVGIEITAEGGGSVLIPAVNFQDANEKVFSAALVNLAVGNYNRLFTARPYVRAAGGDICYGSNSVSRSIYEVAAGILVDGTSAVEVEDTGVQFDEESVYVQKVLNAYVNQVGIRLKLAADGTITAPTADDGTYKGGKAGGAKIFFEVASSKDTDGIYSVTITPKGNAKIFSYWNEYIRLNNAGLSKYITKSELNDDGSLTLTIDPNNTSSTPTV